MHGLLPPPPRSPHLHSHCGAQQHMAAMARSLDPALPHSHQLAEGMDTTMSQQQSCKHTSSPASKATWLSLGLTTGHAGGALQLPACDHRRHWAGHQHLSYHPCLRSSPSSTQTAGCSWSQLGRRTPGKGRPCTTQTSCSRSQCRRRRHTGGASSHPWHQKASLPHQPQRGCTCRSRSFGVHTGCQAGTPPEARVCHCRASQGCHHKCHQCHHTAPTEAWSTHHPSGSAAYQTPQTLAAPPSRTGSGACRLLPWAG
jgi:hypothetical protein